MKKGMPPIARERHHVDHVMNHIQSVQRELEKRGLDAVLITNEINQRYVCGFSFTDGFVLISRENAWLITDSRYIEAAKDSVGSNLEVLLYDNAHPKMRILKDLLPDGIKLAAEDRRLSHAEWLGYGRLLNKGFVGAGDLFENLRASKDEEELRNMVTAQRISERALEETLQIIRPGMTEREVAAELVYQMLKNGSEGNSFDPIVVTGKNTSKPHGVPGDTVLQEGDFLTMDFGCMKNGYCSDMTRTVAVGHATEEMQNIYRIVLEAQLAGIAAARSGIPGWEIDEAARRIIRDAGYGDYFGHGFGHSLGLEIHESPACNPREKRLMPERAVVSAEPGIYLPGKYGVRIEDVMILHPDGAEVITLAEKSELRIVGSF